MKMLKFMKGILDLVKYNSYHEQLLFLFYLHQDIVYALSLQSSLLHGDLILYLSMEWKDCDQVNLYSY